jgi:C1A family cysteine protease
LAVESISVGAWTVTAKDWTTVPGIISSVKDQGKCAAGWAFAAASALESLRVMAYNVTADLSEQQLISCSSPYGNNGCVSGWMNYAYNYVIAKGIATEIYYPYTNATLKNGTRGACRFDGGALKITGYNTVGANCNFVAGNLTSRPLSVGVDATNWRPYVSGIFRNCGSITVNHGVLLVGVNATVWKIKNSWGTGWGVGGYIYLNATNGANTCAVCNTVSYPIVIVQ